MKWTIKITTKATKQIKKLPKSVQSTLLLLLRDLEAHGPTQAVFGKTMVS